MAHIAVVGSGLMGSGIAQVSAAAGHEVELIDADPAALLRARAAIDASLARWVAKGTVTNELAGAARARISTGTELAAIRGLELVIEAVPENLALKQGVFAALEDLVDARALLATNTSAIPITSIAAATAHPERVVGMHFFSPVPVMALCELVRGLSTSDETLARARTFAESVGKTCIVVERDVAGFVTTRLISALVAEAVRLVEQGVASAEDVDLACRLGFGHAMGPLATADLTGLDVLTAAAEGVYQATRDARFSPPELLQRMVAAGRLGRKSGQGFFEYR